MSTTLSTYLTIEKNLAHYQKMTSDDPTVKGATKYYEANIGKVSTIDQFVSNYRLLSYALERLWPRQVCQRHGAGEESARGRHDEFEGAGQHSTQSKLEDVRQSVQFQRHRLQLAELFDLGGDDDLGLRRAAARGKRGRERSRRAARPLFQACRADRHQRLRHYRRPKSARCRNHGSRSLARHHNVADRHRVERDHPPDAAERSPESDKAQQVDRAVRR